MMSKVYVLPVYEIGIRNTGFCSRWQLGRILGSHPLTDIMNLQLSIEQVPRGAAVGETLKTD